MAYSLFLILPAVLVSALIAYFMLKFKLSEDDINSMMTYLVVASAGVTTGISFLLGWNLYEGAGYGLIGGIMVAGGLKVRYDGFLKKKKRRQEKEKAAREAERAERERSARDNWRPPF